jgi:hypothetical protein
MFVRRKFTSVVYVLLVIGGLFLSLFIIKKMKYLYDRNQKYSRLESYKQYVSDASLLSSIKEMSEHYASESFVSSDCVFVKR